MAKFPVDIFINICYHTDEGKISLLNKEYEMKLEELKMEMIMSRIYDNARDAQYTSALEIVDGNIFEAVAYIATNEDDFAHYLVRAMHDALRKTYDSNLPEAKKEYIIGVIKGSDAYQAHENHCAELIGNAIAKFAMQQIG